jgi:hypothetical protein
MWKTLALVAGLVGLCSLSARADGPQGIWKGGCIPIERLEGKLIQKKIRVLPWCGTPDMNNRDRNGRCRPIFITEWSLEGRDGKTTRLVLGESQVLAKKAAELSGKQVVVLGFWAGAGELHVTSLEAADTVLIGKLDHLLVSQIHPRLGRCPDIHLPMPIATVWSLQVEGKTYNLRFASAALETKALSLVGRTVKATGKLEGDTLVVRAIEAAPVC